MDLKQALQEAKTFVTYGEPEAVAGSFDPLKATYNKEKGVWVVVCQFQVGSIVPIVFNPKPLSLKKARVEIDNDSWEIVAYEVID